MEEATKADSMNVDTELFNRSRNGYSIDITRYSTFVCRLVDNSVAKQVGGWSRPFQKNFNELIFDIRWGQFPFQ